MTDLRTHDLSFPSTATEDARPLGRSASWKRILTEGRRVMDDVQLNLVNEEPYAQREAGDPIPFPIGGVFGDTTSPTEAAEAALNSIEDALEQMAEIEHQHAETSAKIHKIFFDTDPDSPRAA